MLATSPFIALQAEQNEAAAPEYFPTIHGVQTSLFNELHLPSAQLLHLDAPAAAYVPAGQLSHVAAPAPAKVPARQDEEQEVTPSPLNFPATQGVHSTRSVELCFPASQARHSPAPVPLIDPPSHV